MPVGGLIPRATDDAADLVVRNAKIHTGDPRLPQAEAIAVRDGVITAVPSRLLVASSPPSNAGVRTATRHPRCACSTDHSCPTLP
jgi:hypothetical protein